MSQAPATIPITDDDLIRQVCEEQEVRGDASPTRTAGKLLLERLAELRVERRTRATQPAETPQPNG